MRIRLEQGLAFVEAVLTFRGRPFRLPNVVLDTGSGGTIFSADRLFDIGISPEPLDTLRRIRGVGGVEFVFTRVIDELVAGDLVVTQFKIEVGAMDYGFDAEGILGLDFLVASGATIDFRRLDLAASK